MNLLVKECLEFGSYVPVLWWSIKCHVYSKCLHRWTKHVDYHFVLRTWPCTVSKCLVTTVWQWSVCDVASRVYTHVRYVCNLTVGETGQLCVCTWSVLCLCRVRPCWHLRMLHCCHDFCSTLRCFSGLSSTEWQYSTAARYQWRSLYSNEFLALRSLYFVTKFSLSKQNLSRERSWTKHYTVNAWCA